MRVIAVDDERIALESITHKLKSMDCVTRVVSFQSPAQALQYVENNEVDVAFLDIAMRQMDGLILAKQIKDRKPKTYVVFTTGFSEFAVQAFKLHVAGYLMKPISEEDLNETLLYIQNPEQEVEEITHNKVQVQCFGDFEVFINGEPVHFKRSKSKEVFAYLIDRVGASSNTSTLCSILWEDEAVTLSMKSQIRNYIAELMHVFEDAGAGEVIVKNRNSYAVNMAAVECDYYDFRKRRPEAVNMYFGEYMSQYPWAEMTLGIIESDIENRK